MSSIWVAGAVDAVAGDEGMAACAVGAGAGDEGAAACAVGAGAGAIAPPPPGGPTRCMNALSLFAVTSGAGGVSRLRTPPPLSREPPPRGVVALGGRGCGPPAAADEASVALASVSRALALPDRSRSAAAWRSAATRDAAAACLTPPWRALPLPRMPWSFRRGDDRLRRAAMGTVATVPW